MLLGLGTVGTAEEMTPPPLEVYLPLRLVSEANARDGWRAKAKRAREQRRVTHMAVAPRLLRGLGTHVVFVDPLRVTLTRIGPRELDTDNLARACKAVRDGVADALGVKDNDPRVSWSYAQLRSRAYAVEIRMEAP